MPTTASRSSKRGGAAAPSASFDLTSMEAIELTPIMIASLLSNVGSTTTTEQESEQSEASTSTLSSPSSSTKRATRSKVNSKPSTSFKTTTAKSPDVNTPSNIYATKKTTTTRTTKQVVAKHKDNNEGEDEEEANNDAVEAKKQQDAASGVVRRTCCHCGRLFKRASDCRRHERIHTNDKPHPCPEAACGKAFVQKSALTTHMRTHTGEKPYTCRHADCPRLFADASSRKKHESTHNKGDKRHYCPLCPRQAFRRKDTLNLHIKRMHPGADASSNGQHAADTDMDKTYEFGAYQTSELTEMDMEDLEEDTEEADMQADELALLAFSAQPTIHPSSQAAASPIFTKSEELAYEDISFGEGETFQYDASFNRSQSAPAEDQNPSSSGHARALSAPILENLVPSTNSFGACGDISSLFFDSAASSSQSSSAASVASSTSNTHNSRYPFTFNAPPLHRSSAQGNNLNNSDGENDSRALSRKPNRQSTTSAEDLFELLYNTPSTPPHTHKNSNTQASHISFFGNRTAPQPQRQPLTRVPSFGTPWAPGSPPKVNSQLFAEASGMFA